MKMAFLLRLLLTMLFFWIISHAQAGVSFSVLSRLGASAQGSSPNPVLPAKDGNFYGTTSKGGAKADGTIFKLTPAGNLTTIYSFTGGTDGFAPLASLVLGKDGNFYGTTSAGGASGAGTFYSMTPTGVVTTLHAFDGTSEGSGPLQLVLGHDGNFYAAAFNAGTSQGDGGAFLQITTAGVVHVLHTFISSTDGGFLNPDLVLGNDGAFYGTSQVGGANGFGTIYRVTTGGSVSVLTNLTTYNDTPFLTTVGNDGLIYGRNVNADTIFSMTNAGVRSTVYTFTKQYDGAFPQSFIQGSDGNFYGTTSSFGANGYGTFFQITASGTFNTLYPFFSTEGTFPGLVQGIHGDLYASNTEGGTGGAGAVIQLTTAGIPTTIHNFAAGGSYCVAALLQGSDGNFYGTTEDGGTTNDGTIFQAKPSGALAELASFNFNGSGSKPASPLIQNPTTGVFYGTTLTGGGRYDPLSEEGGTIFEASPSGGKLQLGPLVSLYGASGTYPAGLNGEIDFSTTYRYGAAGNASAVPTIYSVTGLAGGRGQGTFYSCPFDGTITSLYSFGTRPTDGSGPEAPLVRDSAGNLYGTTSYGGTSHVGTVFKVTPATATSASTLTTIHNFTGVDGAYPGSNNLVLGSDGNIYGTTVSGGAYGWGEVFAMSTAGKIKVLHSFKPNIGTLGADGAVPYAGLVEGSDGNFYGTTSEGGNLGAGTLFSITPTGKETILHSFSGTDGAAPMAGLIQAKNGSFYGVTSDGGGGSSSSGVVFRLTVTP